MLKFRVSVMLINTRFLSNGFDNGLSEIDPTTHTRHQLMKAPPPSNVVV